MPSSVLPRPLTRWAVPVGVTATVIAAAVTVPIIAGADAELPDRSAAELLADLAGAEGVPFAGTVVQSADIGLPELPGSSHAGAGSIPAAAVSLLSGSTTARIWYSDTDQYRVALQDELAETDFVRSGDDAWFWNSELNTVEHLNVPENSRELDNKALHGTALDRQGVTTPPAAAAMALQAFASSTRVDVDGTATVAGRAAYELVIRPRDEQSLIGSVRLAIDGEHAVPLRVQIYGSDGGDPAFEIGFTSVSFSEPDASVFDFTPPPGATVEELDASQLLQQHKDHAPADWDVVGEGWTSVLVVRDVHVDELTGDAGTSRLVEAILDEFDEVSGAYGDGLAMSNDLVSVLLLDDGRLLVGAVPIEVLEEAAQDPQAAP